MSTKTKIVVNVPLYAEVTVYQFPVQKVKSLKSQGHQ